MQNLSEIKVRIKSVADTRQITSAMETVSIAKMKKAQVACAHNKMYFEELNKALLEISKHTRNVTNRYLLKEKSKNTLFIVIVSDKGLAGAYNHAVLEFAHDILKNTEEKVTLFTIGALATSFFSRRGFKPELDFFNFGKPTIRQSKGITEDILNLYNTEMVDAVNIIYTAVEENRFIPKMYKLLPLSDIHEISMEDEDNKKDQQPKLENLEETKTINFPLELEYEPNPEEVFKNLIPQYMTGVIYGTLLQSVAAEHSSRWQAMSNATRNCDELLQKLKLKYNKIRQESITGELIDIITGSMAVTKKR